jgi:hypothetical protein
METNKDVGTVQPSASLWKPIETAPPYPCLIWGPSYRGVMQSFWTGDRETATHWTPLPNPPSAESAALITSPTGDR